MKPSTSRAAASLVIALLTAACSSPARTDAALLPPVGETTSILPATTTTPPPPPTTTSTPLGAGPDLIAWLSDDGAAGTLAEAVTGWIGVGRVELVTSEDALGEFAGLYADRPGLVEGVPASALPASLRIRLSHPSFLGDVAARLRSLSDVDDVTTAVTSPCNPFPDWNVVLFVEDDRDLTRLRNELAAEEGIIDISVFGRDQAYAEYLDRFAGFPDLSAGITVQDMSVSLRAHTANPVTLSLLARRFEADAAVKGVQVFNPGAPGCR